MEQVILVDRDDVQIGVVEKRAAHVSGALHRAFSVFVMDNAGRILLQRRAADKYHSGGLWSNTCCSHPRPGESTATAARRRLLEEMGMLCPLELAFSFIYRADVGGGLIEHEYDHVFLGRFNDDPLPDPSEVSDWRWVEPAALVRAVRQHPLRFTPWFHIAFEQLRDRGYLPAVRNPEWEHDDDEPQPRNWRGAAQL
jgi:isopentenyl-diphosphate Delta-isomerase